MEIETPLGPLYALANEKGLLRLSFFPIEEKGSVLDLLKNELELYFAGKLKTFTTPLHMEGTPFQRQVWRALQQIPYGQTASYKEIATAIGKPTAFRAVAMANKRNPFPIIIPCHRVIHANGDLCGYNGGVKKKRWLLQHEGVKVPSR